MTRDAALEMLELPSTANSADIERAYERVFNDFRIRIDNAPTPALRARFQERLAQLDEAYAALRGSAAGGFADLPASAPVSTGSADSEYSRPAFTQAQNSGDATRPCPFCAEPIRAAAQVCRFCGRDIPPAAASPDTATREVVAESHADRPKKSSNGGKVALVLGLVVAVVVIAVLATGERRSTSAQLISSPAAGREVSPESIAKIREDIVIARNHFERGEYREADSLLTNADTLATQWAARWPADAPNPAVRSLGAYVFTARQELKKACAAEREVAQSRGDSVPPGCAK